MRGDGVRGAIETPERQEENRRTSKARIAVRPPLRRTVINDWTNFVVLFSVVIAVVVVHDRRRTVPRRGRRFASRQVRRQWLESHRLRRNREHNADRSGTDDVGDRRSTDRHRRSMSRNGLESCGTRERRNTRGCNTNNKVAVGIAPVQQLETIVHRGVLGQDVV